MFTGIVQATGKISSIEPQEVCHRVSIQTDLNLLDGSVGESIAVNGCCLTAVSFENGGFQVDIAKESLAITTLGNLEVGDPVNLERAMQLGDRFGGHWVQGHVDGVGTLIRREVAEQARLAGDDKSRQGELWEIQYPQALQKYLVKKGSITIDGVSLTLNEVKAESFEIFLIPHTLEMTTFGGFSMEQCVNLEVDILGKYIETLLSPLR